MLNTRQFSKVFLGGCFVFFGLGCGPQPEVLIVNRLEEPVRLDVYGPKEALTGGCTDDFRERFCKEEFVALSILNLEPSEERIFTMSDDIDEQKCTNVLWIRMLQVGDVGPVSEKGTLLNLPVLAEIEKGAGRYHTAAFPQATLRIDEVGLEDSNQGFAPKTCAELGRGAR
jgi:hypothetical protein